MVSLIVMVAHAQAVTIDVPDPTIWGLVFDCPGEVFVAPVEGGRVLLDEPPHLCAVRTARGRGRVEEGGRWMCTEEGCVPREPEVAVSAVDAPGRLNLVLTTEAAGNVAVDLACGQAHRDRQLIQGPLVRFEGIPEGAWCKVGFVGGQTVWAPELAMVQEGTLICGLTAGRAVCVR